MKDSDRKMFVNFTSEIGMKEGKRITEILNGLDLPCYTLLSF
jgi:hypothetical protein